MPESEVSTTSTTHRARRLFTAGAALCAMWAMLTGAEPSSWIFGGPAIVLALAAVAVLPAAGIPAPRWGALTRLLGFFLVETVRGAFDVGLRALAREPAVDARVVHCRVGLKTPTARLILVHGISLIPGTLTARVAGDRFTVHVLDDGLPWREGIAALESRIAAAFEATPTPDA